MGTVAFPQSRKQSLADQLLIAALLGIIGFFIVVIAGWIALQTSYSGRIFPGVSIAGIDVSGLNPAAAAAKLTQAFEFPQKGRIFLQDGSNAWKVTPAEMGLFLDPEASVTQAYQVGRGGNLFENTQTQLSTWRGPVEFAPVLVFDQRLAYRYLDALAGQINRQVIETSLGLNGAEVVMKPGQKGRELDMAASIALVSQQAQSMQDGVVQLVIKETPPLVGDVTAQAELAKKILSAPLVLSMPADQADHDKKGPWTLDLKTLAAMLSIEQTKTPEGGLTYAVTLKPDLLRTYLKNLAPTLAIGTDNARFVFNDDTKKLDLIQKAVIGRALDVEGTIRAVRDQVSQGLHSASLAMTTVKPAITDDMTGDQLGVKELVYAETSYFYGSSKERVQNIKAASGKFHGLLFPPGATISMSDVLGDITLDNGYSEALIILNGQTIKGVGGGVCQVSTTLFRTAFFAGFPIVQRYAHAYRVSYYEKIYGNKINAKLAGLDATVFVPLVDFKFRNDSSSWLLMETYVNAGASSLTWKFYSTSDGRKVTWETTGPTNIVKPPDPIYRENPDLAKDTIKQVDWAAEGSDVTVNRTVTRSGTVILKDTVKTHYLPWADAFEYGPGTDIPKPNNAPQG